jgi:hypothetical protein
MEIQVFTSMKTMDTTTVVIMEINIMEGMDIVMTAIETTITEHRTVTTMEETMAITATTHMHSKEISAKSSVSNARRRAIMQIIARRQELIMGRSQTRLRRQL